MSYCRQEGKDTIIFVTEEDDAKPSKAVFEGLDMEEDDEQGLILPNGEINFNCPCLGGMATGPCGFEFREAFTCFHHSEADPKGSDCYDSFKVMQDCMIQYPDLYGKGPPEEEEEEDDDEDEDENEEDKMGESSMGGIEDIYNQETASKSTSGES